MTTPEPRSTVAVVLAAGQGTRMKSRLPKVLHPLAGRPLVNHVLDTLEAAGVTDIVTVIGDGMEDVADAVQPHQTAIQQNRLGTAHAVLAARETIAGRQADDVIVLFGDTPLITTETISAMRAAREQPSPPGVVVLGFEPDDPGAYGRLIRHSDGTLKAIVEAKDATPDQLEIGLCNAGAMLIDGGHALAWLDKIGNDNAKGEYYLTDVVAVARKDGAAAAVVIGDANEVLGINSRAELARAEKILQSRLRRNAMAAGVTMTDPETVYLAWDTQLGQDVTIGPNVFFGPGVTVASDVEIHAFCHIEGARIGAGTVVGPFARLRPGADLAADVRIGNFVEIKASKLAPGVKVSHLSYVGDSDIGSDANIGAGTITCNYDGYFKSRTVIGAGAFIGSNTALVAPVTVGAGAIVGAGSTISKDVDADALAVTRAEQKSVAGWAKRFNNRRAKEKTRAKEKAGKKPVKG